MDLKKNSTLKYAAKAGKLQVVNYIIEKNPNLALIKNKKGLLPIHYAASRNHKDIVISLWKVMGKKKNICAGRRSLCALGYATIYNNY